MCWFVSLVGRPVLVMDGDLFKVVVRSLLYKSVRSVALSTSIL